MEMIRSHSEEIARLYDTYGEMLFRLACSILLNRADAEDAVQDMFLKIFGKVPEFQKGSGESVPRQPETKETSALCTAGRSAGDNGESTFRTRTGRDGRKRGPANGSRTGRKVPGSADSVLFRGIPCGRNCINPWNQSVSGENASGERKRDAEKKNEGGSVR